MKNLTNKQLKAYLRKEMDLIVKELELAVKMEAIKEELKLAKQMQDKLEMAIEQMYEELEKLKKDN